MNIPQLTERQERILTLVVREYTQNPEPVSSKWLAEKFLVNISSATIRNELAALEELGLVAAPHTSAGRVPTEAGYRYFVKRLLDDSEMPLAEQKSIAEEFAVSPNNLTQWLQLAASTMARFSRSAALVTVPRASGNQFKHLELISTQGRLVLMVLVLQGGEVRQQMLTLAEPLTQEVLSGFSQKLNHGCISATGEQIRERLISAESEVERELLTIIADQLDEIDNLQQFVIFREGLSHLLSEFTEGKESKGVQQALRLIEEPQVLTDILAETLTQPLGSVQVLIAGEGRWDGVTHVSIVLSRYGLLGTATGALGVLGPTRMHYGRAVTTVRYMAGLMSNLLSNAYSLEGGTDPRVEPRIELRGD